MKIKYLYRNLGIAICILFAVACSDEKLTENEGFISVNPNPEENIKSANEQWDWVGKFPGEVDNSIKRLLDVEVLVNGDYTYNTDSLFVPSQRNLQSSGLYVPPAELVEVIVPDDIPGLSYQVGIADVFIPSEGNAYSRFEQVSKQGELLQGSNIINTNFGGHLYFYYSGEPTPGDIVLTVNNAVKSLDYILDETDTEEWLAQVADTENTPMIWGEIVGKKIILTLPIEALKEIERPENLIRFYDDLIAQDMEPHAGLTDETGVHAKLSYPVRLYADVQLPKNPFITQAQTFGARYMGGYPMAINSSVQENLVQLLINPDFDNPNIKYLMGAFGDTYQSVWNTSAFFGGNTSFLPLYRASHRQFSWPKPHVDFEGVSTKFYNDPTLTFTYLDKDERLGMLVQLAQEYGWNMFGYITQRVREEVKDSVKIDLVKNDLLAIFASEYANTDLTEFFQFWKFPISSFAGESIDTFDPPAEKFWTRFSRSFGDVTSTLPATRLSLSDIPKQDTIYERSEWIGNCSPVQSDKEGNLKKAVDGDPATTWHSIWEGSGGHYPHWVSFTFEEELTFNYVYLHALHWNPPRMFRIEVEDETTGEWIPVENNKNFYFRKNNDVQRFYFNKSYTSKSVRIYFLTSHEGPDDDFNHNMSVSFGEFGIGLIN